VNPGLNMTVSPNINEKQAIHYLPLAKDIYVFLNIATIRTVVLRS
jgi:hypothetical protein